MRKLLDEKFILYTMSSKKLKENNKLFSKTESSSDGRERTAGNNGNPSLSNTQKRRDKLEERSKGSITINKTVEKTLSNSGEPSKSKELHEKAKRESNMTNNFNYPNVLCPHYSGMHLHRQQMLCSNLLTNGVNAPSNLVPNPYYFYRSLSESAVPCQQLSNVYFDRYQNNDGAPGVSLTNTSRHLKTVKGMRSWQLTTLGKILQKLNGGKNPGITFKVMTYNVLAQDLLMDHPELYRDNEQRMLAWEMRWRNIYQEIKEHNCEILCLQEVQQDHMDKYYTRLDGLGYKGIYKQRTGSRSDGCAIYYKKSLFKLIEYTTVEFLQPNITVLDRDNVGLIATFAPIDNPSAEFIIATTHLLYNPRRQDVRLAQMQIFLAEIDRLAYRQDKSDIKYIPIILTGDLNSLPQTPVTDFVVKSVLKYENVLLRSTYVTGKTLIPPWLMITDNCQHAGLLKFRAANKTLSRKDEEKYILQLSTKNHKSDDLKNKSEYRKHKFASGTLSHSFVFRSAYKHNVNNDVEGTTYQGAWVTVDYIFYSAIRDESTQIRDDKLKMLARYILPTREQLTSIKIPNIEQGSDHLSLLAAFKLEY